MTPDQLRIEMLRKGNNPYKEVNPREWHEYQVTFQSLYTVIDPYVVPEKSTKFQDLEGSNLWEKLRTTSKLLVKDRFMNAFNYRFNGINRIKKKENLRHFDPKEFPKTAETIYINAHKALCERNTTELHKYITEHAFGKLWPDVRHGSVNWELLKFNDPSRVVSVRCADNPHKSGNDIAQVIVRMHSTQKLAIYDRFGRLLLGSEEEPRFCLEYVVFENHIASLDGDWRFHDKVYPKWLDSKQPVNRQNLIDRDNPTRPKCANTLSIGMQDYIGSQTIKKDDVKKQ